MINLGDAVRDGITGFTGIVAAKTEWLNGCVRFGIQSRNLAERKPVELQWFDEPQLEVIGRVEEGQLISGVVGGARPIETG